MAFLIPAVFFVFGLCIGSFLNVAILRGAAGESLGGRSRCPGCRRMLGVAELIPVASFLRQRGACRGCGQRISVQYPLVELATAASFAAIAAYALPSGSAYASLNIEIFKYLNIVAACAAAAAAIVVLVSDLRFQLIPDGATAALVLAGLFFSIRRDALAQDLVLAFGCSFFFFLLWYASRGRWMGFGDVKLIFATSLLVGFPAGIAALLFAFWIGGIVGGLLLLLGTKQWGSRIPFGPCILAGAAAAALWADVFLAFTGIGLML